MNDRVRHRLDPLREGSNGGSVMQYRAQKFHSSSNYYHPQPAAVPLAVLLA
jgi:hypothetical protein